MENTEKTKLEINRKSTPKTKMFSEYLKCLNWVSTGTPLAEKNFDENGDNYFIRNRNHEIYFQKVDNLALNAFDDERRYLNNIGSESWA